MKKIRLLKKLVIGLLLFFVWFIFMDFFLLSSQDNLYYEICTQGLEGYRKFRQQFGGKVKSKFWTYFDNLTRDFADQGKYANILACAAFWRYFKEDDLFDYDENAKADRTGIEDIFKQALDKYKEKPLQAIVQGKFLDTSGEYSREQIMKFTGDKGFADNIFNYIALYNLIKAAVPIDQKKLNLFASNWNKMKQEYTINSSLVKNMDEYIQLWQGFYKIYEGNTYQEKASINQEKQKKLQTIKRISKNIQAFDVPSHSRAIDPMIDNASRDQSKWQAHANVEQVLNDFNALPEPTFDDLHSTIKKIKGFSMNITLEPQLHDRIIPFFNIPGNPDIQWFSANLSTNWDKNKIETVLATKFYRQLNQELERLMLAGGNQLADLAKIKKLQETYGKYFAGNIPWSTCTNFLFSFYQEKEKKNYPAMLALYPQDTGNSGHTMTIECKKVLQSWGIPSKEALIKEFGNYYQEKIRNVLDDMGEKNRALFLEFEKIKEGASVLGEFPVDYKDRYDLVKSYFIESHSDEEKKVAAEKLYKSFPGLARSYHIPGSIPAQPATNSTTPGKTQTISNPDEIFSKLENLWKEIEQKKMEEDARNCLKKCSFIATDRTGNPEKTLEQLFAMNEKWSRCSSSIHQVRALVMIGRIATLAGYPKKQEDIYSYILKNIKPGPIIFNAKEQSPPLNNLEKVICSNQRYRKLFQYWKEKKSIALVDLEGINNKLQWSLLTVEQQIRAHYMLAQLYQEQSSNTSCPCCYHYGSINRLFKELHVDQVMLLWSDEGIRKRTIIVREEMKDNANKFCRSIKGSTWEMNKFKEKYKNKIQDIEAFIWASLYLEIQYNETLATGNGVQPGNSDDLIQFLDYLFRLIKNSQGDNPEFDSMYRELIRSSRDFLTIRNKYKGKLNIPDTYTSQMNFFFSVLLERNNNTKWAETAQSIINEANWKEEIKQKMGNFLQELERN